MRIHFVDFLFPLTLVMKCFQSLDTNITQVIALLKLLFKIHHLVWAGSCVMCIVGVLNPPLLLGEQLYIGI